MSQIFTAIILDGGEVPNFLDPNTPKGLTEINGKSIFERQVEQIRATGISNIIVSSFKFAEEYDEYIKNNSAKLEGLNVYSTKERVPLGSGGAVKNTMLNTNIEQALVLNGNSFINIDLQSFVDFHFQNYFENSLCVTKESNGSHKYAFELENNALKKLIVGEPEAGQYLNAGAYILDVELFNLTHLQTFSMSQEILPKLCDGTFGAFDTNTKLLTISEENGYKDTVSALK